LLRIENKIHFNPIGKESNRYFITKNCYGN